MENASGGQNKLVVLIAVGIIGAAAGQQFLKPAAPQGQQNGPWGPGYPLVQPQMVYPPGYGPSPYGPSPYAPPGYPQPLPTPYPPPGVAMQPEPAPAEFRARQTTARSTFASSPGNGRVIVAQHVPDVPDEESGFAFEEPGQPAASPPPRRIAAAGLMSPQPPDPVVPQPPQWRAPVLQSITDGDLDWSGTGIGNVWLKSDTLKVAVQLSAEAGAKQAELVAQIDNDAPIVIDQITSATELNFTSREFKLNAAPGSHSFKVGIRPSDGDQAVRILYSTRDVRIHVPAGNDAPTMIKAAATRFAVSTDPGKNDVNVYGGYLKLDGRAAPSSRIQFLLTRPGTGTDASQIVSANLGETTSNANGQWEQELAIPGPGPGVTGGQVRVMALGNGGHTFAASPVSIRHSLRSAQPAIEITGVTQGAEPKQPKFEGRFNERDLTISVASDMDVQDGILALMADGSSIPLAKSGCANGTNTLRWQATRDDNLTLRVELLQGASALQTSKPVTVSIRTTGPRPTGISPTNLSQTPGQNVIRIAFNPENPLDQSTVQGADFVLTNLADSSKTLSASAANYNSTDNVVDAVFPSIAEGAYRLSIGSGRQDIQDVYGNSLGLGADGQLITFGVIKPVGADVPSAPTVGLSNLTGPYVPYQEYTSPREVPSGFNPSDKVVTRVARLYYYRDAHRVVQLINRGARSYNRQAVDMQQQLADNARQQAELATGERREAEQKAIQAAQRARASETALNQFQQALVAARQKQATAETAQQQKQQAHTTLQDDLEEVTARRQELEQIDPTAMSSTEKMNHAAALQAEQQRERSLRRSLSASNQELTQRQTELTKAQAEVTDTERHVNALLAEIQNARNEEAQQRQTLERRQFEEDTRMKDLFRREVAAAHEDPDTYAPGKPNSSDPIEQVSLSVIGEGLIQLRGPMKGVNLARTLINQIDAPVGQVKVAIHTVQVNGEHASRMEPVIGRIQRYIDHSRFLTMQSGQMLRNAVTLVASRRADQVNLLCEGMSQAARDQKYIEAFFGREFLDELRALDSEFLHTGNKLLSIHSMDSTSLSNALFLLSLAKNDVRQEILSEFERMVTCQLPEDELEYFTASSEKYKFGPPFHKQKFMFYGHNAKFVSLRGFFNADVAGADTMTPLQREFIRLAQIFKSRLVTEIELQQRVMERSLIEERIGDYARELADSRQKELNARQSLEQARETLRSGRVALLEAATQIEAHARAVQVSAKLSSEQAQGFVDFALSVMDSAKTVGLQNKTKADTTARELIKDVKSHQLTTLQSQNQREYSPNTLLDIQENTIEGEDKNALLSQSRTVDAQTQKQITVSISESVAMAKRIISDFSDFTLDEERMKKLSAAKRLVDAAEASIRNPTFMTIGLVTLSNAFDLLQDLTEHVASRSGSGVERIRNVIAKVTSRDPDIRDAYVQWVVFEKFITPYLAGGLKATADRLFPQVNEAFKDLIVHKLKTELAEQTVDESRRPLDHKKFMDMLIDDVEDKYIELMEGTRAHTANIDNYLSRLGQALEDDFNTQFYFPAFKGIREASRFWDVNLGQVETTTILTNNRMLAKVSPQATMEFDLPKRDILIKESFDAAMAAYDDYGALLGDPTFLALAKMHRGQPASALFGSDASNPLTRNVLPGLPSSTDEGLVAQNRAVAPDFPTALESLIPDPAIYKFETGTGYEIRPVIQPDGQAVVFHFNYMYTTTVREPVRADEKHLGRVKRHFIDTDVQTGNYELREVSKYQVALKASRTARGVPLLEDIPVAGVIFRPMPNQESSIQQNIILAQSVIFPTLFDLMGLRWAPAVADLDALRLQESDFVTRARQRGLRERVFDYSSQQVDEFLRIPPAERRTDLYRPQETTPHVHPNGYSGPGLNLKDGVLREGYAPEMNRPESRFVPGTNPEGAIQPGQPREAELLPEGTVLPLLPPHAEFGPPQRPAGQSPQLNSAPARPVTPGATPKVEPAPGAFSVPPSPSDANPQAFRSSEFQVPAPRSGRSSRPGAEPGRSADAGTARIELQSYQTGSPEKMALPPVSRPVHTPAGTPPRRLPASDDDDDDRRGAGLAPSIPSGFSPAPPRPHVQSARVNSSSATTRSAPVQPTTARPPASPSAAESAAPAKKKSGISSFWSRKP